MIQHLEPNIRNRHRHCDGYAALVLSGSYEEVGDTGRWSIEAGDIVYHRPYEAHANLIHTACTVMNIPVPAFVRLPPVFRVACSEDLIKFANHGWPAFSELLNPHEVKLSKTVNWCDRLAQDLQAKPVRLRYWSTENGLRIETLSRRFKQVYGVTPARYRFEAQTRFALELIAHHAGTLAETALRAGFSDQAHMSRAIKTLTGYSPTSWRKVNFVQDSLSRDA